MLPTWEVENNDPSDKETYSICEDLKLNPEMLQVPCENEAFIIIEPCSLNYQTSTLIHITTDMKLQKI